MAQTIAMLRGASSKSWDDSTASTLFTLSSGAASRIITSQLCVYGASNAIFQIYFYISNATSGDTLIGGFYDGANGAASMTFVPNTTPDPWAVSTTPTSPGFAWKTNSGRPQNTAPSTTYPTISSSTSVAFYFPTNFWMGNGDSLTVKGKWGANQTGGYQFSFVSVTET